MTMVTGLSEALVEGRRVQLDPGVSLPVAERVKA
jgi:hypothetical protein